MLVFSDRTVSKPEPSGQEKRHHWAHSGSKDPEKGAIATPHPLVSTPKKSDFIRLLHHDSEAEIDGFSCA